MLTQEEICMLHTSGIDYKFRKEIYYQFEYSKIDIESFKKMLNIIKDIIGQKDDNFDYNDTYVDEYYDD